MNTITSLYFDFRTASIFSSILFFVQVFPTTQGVPINSRRLSCNLHCLQDTGFENRDLVIRGRARHPSVKDAKHIIEHIIYESERGKKCCFFETRIAHVGKRTR